MEREEFIRRFSAEMIRLLGDDYSDGALDYAREVAGSYFDDPYFSDEIEDPEECARTDMSYWEA